VARLQHWSPASLPLPADYGAALLALLAWPDIASKESVFRQYDYTVQTNTVLGPGGDAAVLRIKNTNKAIALATDGNGRYCYLDPETGGAAAVAEAARNVVCVGARPLAITDCLNFGNPEKPEVYYQLEYCIEGMSRACEVLGTPVVSGNVSLYNETRDAAIYPTPIVGMLGLLEDRSRRCDHAFKNEGDLIYLLGETRDELGGTAYLEAIHGLVAGPPPCLDLPFERAVQECLLQAIQQGLLQSAHDCSDGGLAMAIAESCIAGGVGAQLALPAAWATLRPDAALFSESQSRIVVSLAPDQAPSLEALARQHSVPCHRLGTVGGPALTVAGLFQVDVPTLEQRWRRGLPAAGHAQAKET
jgi:phosphoribosylformylglycinamidine synthase